MRGQRFRTQNFSIAQFRMSLTTNHISWYGGKCFCFLPSGNIRGMLESPAMEKLR